MNTPAHFLINYVILSFFIPEIQKYIFPIVVFSMIVDLDHVPGFIKTLFMTKKEKSKLTVNDYINIFRHSTQEPIGIFLIMLTLSFLYLFGIKSELIIIAIACIFLHWLVDFLTVHTRPFAPISNKVVSLFFHTKKQRMVSEMIISCVFLLLFLITFV